MGLAQCHQSAPRIWTLQHLVQSSVTKATRSRGRPHTSVPTPGPVSDSEVSASRGWAPPGGARGGHALARRAAPPSLWWLGSGRSGGALPRGGRGRARGGSDRAGRPGMGGGGLLPGAGCEDVATAPGYPSAPETPARLSPQPPCLRRPRPGSGPSPPLPSQVRAGQAAAAGEEEAAAAALGSASAGPGVGSRGRPESGALLGLGSRQAVVRGRLLCAGRGLRLSLPTGDGGRPASLEVCAFKVARTCPIKSPLKGSISPVGAVTGDVCSQIFPNALQIGTFSWLVGGKMPLYSIGNRVRYAAACVCILRN